LTVSNPPPPDTSEQQPIVLVPLVRPGHHSRAELPLPLTSFVGREHELEATCAALRRDGVRLLTLTGPGGVGKSRLVLRVAEGVTDSFPDGVWFVTLAPVHDPALVAVTVAKALGVREVAGRSLVEGLQAFFQDRRALLILDNFEHVVEAAPLVTDLLATCPELSIVVTSRSVLRLSGEQTYFVPPLAVPDLDGLPSLEELGSEPVICLFAERARAMRDDFVLTTDNAATVAQICQRLEGLPLAIELAAARCNILTPQALLDRLEQRLPLLISGPRDAPARLRSMRDAIIWTYDLLSEEERVLFRRLAVFVGEFTLEAAEYVCQDEQGPRTDAILDGVASLVDKSLLRPLPGATRYGMLETIKEFGLEQLLASGEEETLRQRHADYIFALAKRAGPQLLAEGGLLQWLAVFDDELPNLRAALAWLNNKGCAARAAELMFGIWRFWLIRDRFREGANWCERVLDHSEQLPGALRATILAERGLLEFPRLTPEQALVTLDEAVHCALLAQDAHAIAWSHAVRSMGRLRTGDYEDAFADAELALAIYTDLGEEWFVANSLWHIGLIRYFSGDVDGATGLFPQYFATMSALGDQDGLAAYFKQLGGMAIDRHDEEGALSHFLQLLACGRLLDADYLIADAVEGIAVVLARRGESERAVRLLGAIDALRTSGGPSRVPARDAYVKPTITSLRETLGPDTMEAAWQEGRAMPIDDVLGDAETVEALPPHTRSSETPFTRREQEVLRLLVEGKSDPQIAAALYISRRTAASHVASIFRKLRVNSRAAAAAQAVRRGLA
jgi:predicted ATPase/DNA-binding CsgD family transcriptional regulator